MNQTGIFSHEAERSFKCIPIADLTEIGMLQMVHDSYSTITIGHETNKPLNRDIAYFTTSCPLLPFSFTTLTSSAEILVQFFKFYIYKAAKFTISVNYNLSSKFQSIANTKHIFDLYS
mgnify:CR=1 FL=1